MRTKRLFLASILFLAAVFLFFGTAKAAEKFPVSVEVRGTITATYPQTLTFLATLDGEKYNPARVQLRISCPKGVKVTIAGKTSNCNTAVNMTKISAGKYSLSASINNTTSFEQTITYIANAFNSSGQIIGLSQQINKLKLAVKPSLKVVLPNGGGAPKIGSVYPIVWEAYNLDKVTIKLTPDDGATSYLIASDVPASPRFYKWKIPADGSVLPGTKYKISVESADGKVIDYSDNYFKIVAVTHKECNSQGQCVSVNGPGVNQCAQNSSCVVPKRAVCSSSKCVILNGAGLNECANNSDCTPMHNECAQNKCVVVSGAGLDQCYDDVDCTPPTHAECKPYPYKCVAVSGAGPNQCISDDDCAVVGHNKCLQSQCVKVDGAGVDECISNSDCVQPSIKITSPNGGEKWAQGSNWKVSWEIVNIAANNSVKIIARKGYPSDNYVDYVLRENTPNDGYEMINPDDFANFPLGQYVVAVKTIVNDVVIDDWSDSYFEIVAATTGMLNLNDIANQIASIAQAIAQLAEQLGIQLPH